MNKQVLFGTEVLGVLIDPETRCLHYHLPEDIVAICFKCCSTYYCCYKCHEALADHPAIKWDKEDIDVKAILCGDCGKKLTLREYLEASNKCPQCNAAFNSACKEHRYLYFSF